MDAGRPPVMPSADDERGLLLVVGEIPAGLRGVVVLEVVAGMVILVLGQHEQGVVRRELKLHRGIPFDAIQFVVGADSVVVLKIEVEGIAELVQRAKLRCLLTPLTVAPVFGRAGEAEAVAFE